MQPVTSGDAAASTRKRPYFEIINPEIPLIARRLGRGLQMLDVGCGSGLHGSAMKVEFGHKVYGVDNSESSIEKARTRIDDAVVGDVRHPDEYRFSSGTKRFDLLLFSDILEHMVDPLEILQSHLQLLAPSGHVIVSIPNIAIWEARLRLLFGIWEYQDTGTFDRTHLRFFTKRSMLRMIREAGLEVLDTRISPGVVRPFVPLVKAVYGARGEGNGGGDSSSILDSAPYQAYQKLAYPVERFFCGIWPGLFAFQFIFLCRRRGASQ